eukprot:scaffold356_cov363-Prasinococcus_capsulatus_cf.AAC.4
MSRYSRVTLESIPQLGPANQYGGFQRPTANRPSSTWHAAGSVSLPSPQWDPRSYGGLRRPVLHMHRSIPIAAAQNKVRAPAATTLPRKEKAHNNLACGASGRLQRLVEVAWHYLEPLAMWQSLASQLSDAVGSDTLKQLQEEFEQATQQLQDELAGKDALPPRDAQPPRSREHGEGSSGEGPSLGVALTNFLGNLPAGGGGQDLLATLRDAAQGQVSEREADTRESNATVTSEQRIQQVSIDAPMPVTASVPEVTMTTNEDTQEAHTTTSDTSSGFTVVLAAGHSNVPVRHQHRKPSTEESLTKPQQGGGNTIESGSSSAGSNDPSNSASSKQSFSSWERGGFGKDSWSSIDTTAELDLLTAEAAAMVESPPLNHTPRSHVSPQQTGKAQTKTKTRTKSSTGTPPTRKEAPRQSAAGESTTPSTPALTIKKGVKNAKNKDEAAMAREIAQLQGQLRQLQQEASDAREAVATLQSEQDRYLEEKARTDLKLQEYELAGAASQKELEVSREEEKQLEEQLSALNEQLHRLRKSAESDACDLRNSSASLKEAMIQINFQKEEITSYSNALEAAKQAKQDYEERISQMRVEVETVTRKCHLLEEGELSQKAAMDEREQELEQSSAALKSLTQQLEDARKELAKNQQLEQQHEAAGNDEGLVSRRGSQEEASQSSTAVCPDENEPNRRNNELESCVSSLQRECEEVRTRLATSQRESASEIDDLATQLAEARSRAVDMQQLADEYKGRCEQSETTLLQHEQIKAMLKEREKEKDSVEQILRERDETISLLLQEATASKARYDDLESAMQEKINELEARITEEDAAGLTERLQVVENDRENLSTELTATQKDLKDAQIKHQEETDELKRELKVVREGIATAREQFKEKERDLTASAATNSSVDELQAHVQQLTADLKAAELRIDETEDESNEIAILHEELSVEVDELKSKLVAKESLMTALQASLHEKEAQLLELRREHDEECIRLKRKDEEHMATISDLESSLATAGDEANAARVEVEVFSDRVRELESQCTQKQIDYDTQTELLTSKLSRLEDELSKKEKDYEREKVKARNAVKQLKKNLDSLEADKLNTQTALEERNDNTMSTLISTQQQHSATLSELNEQREMVAQLSQELRAYKLRAQTLLKKKEEELLGALEQENVTDLQTELDAARVRMAAMETDLVSKQALLEETQARVEDGQEQHRLYMERQMAKIAALEATLQAASSEAEHYKELAAEAYAEPPQCEKEILASEDALRLSEPAMPEVVTFTGDAQAHDQHTITVDGESGKEDALPDDAVDETGTQLGILQHALSELQEEYNNFRTMAQSMEEASNDKLQKLLDQNAQLKQELQQQVQPQQAVRRGPSSSMISDVAGNALTGLVGKGVGRVALVFYVGFLHLLVAWLFLAVLR